MITINGIPIHVTQFPDGTSQVWKLQPEQLVGPAVVRWEFGAEAEVMQLAQLALLLRETGVTARLELGYLPYARQDKAVANDATFALRAFAPMLNAMQWEMVTLYDPHSAVAEELIHPSQAVYFAHSAVLAMRQTDSDLICFPDAGALAKYKPLFWGIPSVSAEKIRDPSTGRVSTGAIQGGVLDQRVMIVDDICDGGATFIGLAAKLREAGAKDVFLFVSHGLFTRGVKALTDAGISRVFTPKAEVFP